MQDGGWKMTVTGAEELLSNIKMLEAGYDRKARKAVREGGKYFGETLAQNTPVSTEDHSGKGPLRDHMKVGSVSVKTGEYEVPVGYDRTKGPIAHFPNSGTSKQDPQHFIEKTQDGTRDAVLQIFVDNLKVGD